MEVSGKHHAPAALPPREITRVHIEFGAEWAAEPVWTVLEKKFLPLPVFESGTLQPLV